MAINNFLSWRSDTMNLQYKPKEHEENLGSQNINTRIFLHQDAIFQQLFITSIDESSFLHALLNNLSQTLINAKSASNEFFFSQQFLDFLNSTLEHNPNRLIQNDAIKIIFKLLFFGGIDKFPFFIKETFLQNYLNLLFLDEDGTTKNLQTDVMRLLSFISNSEKVAPQLINYVNPIIELHQKPQSFEFLLFLCSFLYPFIKHISEYQLNIHSTFIAFFITQNNVKLRESGLLLFQRYLLNYIQYNPQSDEKVFELFQTTFPDLFNQVQPEILSAVINIYNTSFSIDLSIPVDSQFNTLLIQFLSHYSSLVTNSALRCLSTAIQHSFPIQLNPEFIAKLLSLFSAPHSSLQMQERVVSVFSAIITNTDQSIIAQMPISDILHTFIHIFESDISNQYKMMFRAVYILCDAVRTFSLPVDNLKPLFEFDFTDYFESYPVQINLITSILSELSPET